MSATRPLPEMIEILAKQPGRNRERTIAELWEADPAAATAVLARCIDDVRRYHDENEALKAANAELTTAVTGMRELIEEVTQPPLAMGVVLRSGPDDRCLVAVGHQRQQVGRHPEFNGTPLRPGDHVYLSKDANLIVALVDDYRPPGRVAKVLGKHDDKLLVDHLPDQPLAVDLHSAIAIDAVREGDSVLYDEATRIVLSIVERCQDKTESDAFEPVPLEAIGGLDDQIDELFMAVETRLLRPELADALGIEMLSGAILAGPPGTGKTLLVRVLATYLCQAHGKRVVFKNVAPGSWRTSFYGETEKRIVAPLRSARRLIDEQKADLVILFYDEVDTLGTRSTDVTNHIDARVMTAFLHELDGLSGRSGVLVFGATNRLDMVDNALLRPGRFGDLIIEIPRPNREAARAIFRCHLQPDLTFHTAGAEVPGTLMVERSIDAALARLFADADPAQALVELVLQGGQRRPLFGRDLLSGAAIANIVQKAKQLALRRSLVGPVGLVPDDFAQAAELWLDEAARLLLDPIKVRETLGDRQLPVARVEPVRRRRA